MRLLSLESFDAQHETDPTEIDAYQQGFRAGVAQATMQLESDQKSLRADFVQAVSDLQFTYSEARHAFFDTLEPLFVSIPEKILPACIDAAFTLQIGEALTNAARNSSTEKMTLTVNPAMFDAVQAIVFSSVLDVIIQQDSALSENAMCIGRTSGETLIDLDTLSEQIKNILDAITQSKERENYG